MDGNDPLSRLFDVSSIQDQKELLAETVFPFARIDAETLEIVFTEDGEQLVMREKMLVFLLMRKVLFLRNLIPKEPVSPSEIEKTTGWAGGTLRPLLRKLLDEKLVRSDKTEDGGYLVANNKIKEINTLLSTKGSKA